MPDSLSELVREKWSSLLAEGFAITSEDHGLVALASSTVQVVAAHDPRGEVDVYVFPRGAERHEGWSYTGMVGTASVGRLLEIALAQMQADPAILSGDAAFYERLAQATGASSQEWTAYFAGRGPRPKGDRKLP